MSDASWVRHYFRRNSGLHRVLLPFPLSEILEGYAELRARMARSMPEEFAREEWAYLIRFIDPQQLQRLFTASFGEESPAVSEVDVIYRPRGRIAIWLPNNVSLLGPLLLVLSSMTGNPVTVKRGLEAVDLAGAFQKFILEHDSHPVVSNYFTRAVEILALERDDPRQHEMSKSAEVRIVFGGDAAARAVDSLDHRPDTPLFSFIDRSSEAWIGGGEATDAVLSDLIKVFAIYGKAGCTSPQRLILLNATRAEAIEVRNRICALWPNLVRRDVQPHHASENVMAAQWATALGWDVATVDRNRGLVAVGSLDLAPFESYLSLCIVPATQEQACDSVPKNVQTIGLAGGGQAFDIASMVSEKTTAKRIVEIGSMHHFDGIWDGFPFWLHLFEHIPVTVQEPVRE
jgi:hypothetical protein